MFLKLQRVDGKPVTIQTDKIVAYGPDDAGTGALIMLEGGINRDVTMTAAQLDVILFATAVPVPPV